jgi:peroxiredoxin
VARRSGFIAALVLALAAGCRGNGAGDTPAAPLRPLAKGELAPDFSALSHIGYRVTISALASQKPVGVFVCDLVPDAGCAAAARDIREAWLDLNQRLGMVLFVTPSETFGNAAYASEHELPFLLLADPERNIAKRLGVDAATPRGFLIAPDRKVLESCPIQQALACLGAMPHARTNEEAPAAPEPAP